MLKKVFSVIWSTNRVFWIMKCFNSSSWCFPSFPCSPYSPNWVHILQSWIPGFHHLWSPDCKCFFNIFCKKYSGIVACHPPKGYLGRGQCVTVQKNAPKVQKTGLHTHGSTLNYATIRKFIYFWLVSLAISLMEWIWKITITWPFYEWRLSDVIKTWINLNIV